MSKNKKGMICILNDWESKDWHENGISPDCRNHRHLSRRRVCERLDDARFADRILAHVYNSRRQRIGSIAQVGQRVIWTRHCGDLRCDLGIANEQREMINAHLKRLQGMIDSGKRLFADAITLPQCRTEPRNPPQKAAINETIRSYSPSSLTTRDSELNAEYVWLSKRSERPRQQKP
jgi:hypothetical protein